MNKKICTGLLLVGLLGIKLEIQAMYSPAGSEHSSDGEVISEAQLVKEYDSIYFGDLLDDAPGVDVKIAALDKAFLILEQLLFFVAKAHEVSAVSLENTLPKIQVSDTEEEEEEVVSQPSDGEQKNAATSEDEPEVLTKENLELIVDELLSFFCFRGLKDSIDNLRYLADPSIYRSRPEPKFDPNFAGVLQSFKDKFKLLKAFSETNK